MRVTISQESPLGEDVRALVAALNETLLALTPAEFCYHMTAEEMAGDDTTVYVARDDAGRAVAIGALRRHAGGVGEVKRMFTIPQTRGHVVGRAILAELEREARAEGLRELVLETGDKGYGAAWRVYEVAGFQRCGPVLDYTDTGYSVFYRKSLESNGAAAPRNGVGRGAQLA